MTSDHAQAVLFMCRQLTSSDHTVISANTDEKGEPQIFAQDATGKLAFFSCVTMRPNLLPRISRVFVPSRPDTRSPPIMRPSRLRLSLNV